MNKEFFKYLKKIISKEVLLSDVLSDRNNNFTPLRLFLAWSVLYGHSFAIIKIATGNNFVDPISNWFAHTWIGAIAVEIFFALSGIFIAKSFVDRSLSAYIFSRILRIYPGLIICILLSVFIIGPITTSIPISDYFQSKQTYEYLTNMTLINDIQWYLPGIMFEEKKIAANGSLWTLPVEVRCYLLLMVLGVFGVFRSKLFTISIALLLWFVSIHAADVIPLVGHKIKFLRPSAYFLLGVLAYQFSKYILLNWRTGIFAIILIIIFNRSNLYWHELSAIPFIYITLCIGYLTPFLNWDKKVGDLSYAMYVYAWPVQVFCLIKLGAITPFKNTLFATIITLFLAWLSWNYVEKPALKLKSKLLRSK